MERNNVVKDMELQVETLAGIITVNYDFHKKEVTMEQADAQFIKFEGDKQKLLQAIGLDISEYNEKYPIVYGSSSVMIKNIRFMEGILALIFQERWRIR